MRYSDLKSGMNIRATADYGGCIAKGQTYLVFDVDGILYIECAMGPHELKDMADDRDGDLPEFEPV